MALGLGVASTAATGFTLYDQPSYNNSRDVEQTHFGAKHAAGEGGTLCWDCHEAHGGSATNILMVKDFLSIASSSYGVPTTTTTTALSTFTARAAATDFVDTTAPTEASSGLCQKCHVNKAVPDVKFWRNDGTEDANQDNTNDAGIHGFEPAPAGDGVHAVPHAPERVCGELHALVQ